jgi:hypothetical protein
MTGLSSRLSTELSFFAFAAKTLRRGLTKDPLRD